MKGLARVLLFGCSLGVCLQAQPSSLTDWIRAHAIRLTTVEAGHGFEDLIHRIISSTSSVSHVQKYMPRRREFNKSGRGRLQFTGFDMQVPNVAAELVRDFVTRYDAKYVETIRDATAMATTPIKAAGATAAEIAMAVQNVRIVVQGRAHAASPRRQGSPRPVKRRSRQAVDDN